jgi:MFS family permease
VSSSTATWPERSRLRRASAFRLLWTAHTVSAFGDAVTLVALPSAAILTLHAGGFAVGGLSAAQGAAWAIFGLVAGVWVDRLPRRIVLVTCDVLRALLLLTILVAAALGALTVWQLIGVAAVGGTATVFFSLAATTTVPTLVEPEDYTEANARLELSTSTAQMVGPTLAGALVGVVGAPFALLADAVSFAASATLVRSVPQLRRAPRRARFHAELREGIRALRARPPMVATTAATGLSNFGLAMSQAVLLLFVYRGVHVHALAAGVALGLGACGNVAGAALAPAVTRRLGTGRSLVVATTLEGLGLLPILFGLLAAPVLWVALALGLRGLFNPLWNVNSVSLRMRLVPHELQARVSAASRTVALGTWPLGALAGGALGQALAGRYGAAHGYALVLAFSSVVAASSGLLVRHIGDD